jgi:hypothetical protein
LDRAYRDVVSFAETPNEIIEIVNNLLSNRTELRRRSEEGKKFIELKVQVYCPFGAYHSPPL